jgi:hypothetical protein
MPYHEACMRRTAIVAMREFTERMARRFERMHSRWQEGAELLRNATRELGNGAGRVEPTNADWLPPRRGSRCADEENPRQRYEPGPGLMRQSNTRAASVEAEDFDRPSH